MQINKRTSMKHTLSPHEVFLALVNGVAQERWNELPNLYAEQTHVVHPFDPLRGSALRTRDELREHFKPTGAGPRLDRRATNITIHETTDPEVISCRVRIPGNSRRDRGEIRAAGHLRDTGAQRRNRQLATTSTISPRPESAASSTPLSQT